MNEALKERVTSVVRERVTSMVEERVGEAIRERVGDAIRSAMAASLSATHDREALKARAQDFSIDKAADRYLELLFPSQS